MSERKTNTDVDYFDLTTEVDVPKPIRIKTTQGESLIIQPPTRRQMRAQRDAQTVDESDRALLGENYDALCAHFDDLPRQHWNDFIDKLTAHFFGPGAGETPGKSPA